MEHFSFLFQDNVGPHVKAVNQLILTNTLIECLPPNTTSQTQLADAGWIQAIKAGYRNQYNMFITGMLVPVHGGEA